MARPLCCLVVLASLTVISTRAQSWTGDYLTLGQPCDPKAKDMCFPGLGCNAKTKTCDCADSTSGLFKRTFQNKECRLLPGSECIRNVNQENYRCVDNSKCTETRKGQDPSECVADGKCDTGDHHCVCNGGAECLTQKVSAPPAPASKGRSPSPKAKKG